MNTSAPFIASSSVRALVSIAWTDLNWSMPFRVRDRRRLRGRPR